MTIHASTLTLLGGAPCLDFVNTKNWSAGDKPYDFFKDYDFLLAWNLQLGLISPPQAEELLKLAGQQGQRAQATLEQARLLRETIYRIFAAIANAQEVPPADLKRFNDAWNTALENLQVLSDDETFRWGWVGTNQALDSVFWPVLHSAAELLISEKLNRIRDCDGCGWLFLDTTKGGRRRWCDMRLCGNRAKSKRHYARGKAGMTQ